MPELGGEEAAEGVVNTKREETGAAEDGGMVWQVSGAETGEQAEGKVEGTYEKAGDRADWPGGRDAEVGEDPESAGREASADCGDEVGEIRFGEAVEEEVRGDEVKGGLGRCGERGEGISVMRGKAMGGKGAATGEESQHGAAGVDGGGVEVGIAVQQSGEKAAISVAKDERVAAVGEGWQEGGSSADEGAAEGEGFEETVGTGDAVEAGRGGHQRWRSQGRKRRGEVRARSAAARRVRGERR